MEPKPMVHSLDEVLTARREADGLDAFDVPEGFAQGRATFGGLVVGVCVRSLEARVAGPDRKLRSVSAQLLGAPRPGPALIHVRLLRESATVTTLSADLEQEGAVMTHVVGVFAADRPVPLAWNQLRPPPAPPWRTVDPMDADTPFAPEFTRHFEFRPVVAVPFSGSTDDPLGYIRPRVPCARRDGAYVACLVDTWWLAALCRFDGPRPAATMTYAAELHVAPGTLDPEAPLLHVGRALASRDGYSVETRELWTPDGQLVTTGSQVVVIVK